MTDPVYNITLKDENNSDGLNVIENIVNSTEPDIKKKLKSILDLEYDTNIFDNLEITTDDDSNFIKDANDLKLFNKYFKSLVYYELLKDTKIQSDNTQIQKILKEIKERENDEDELRDYITKIDEKELEMAVLYVSNCEEIISTTKKSSKDSKKINKLIDLYDDIINDFNREAAIKFNNIDINKFIGYVSAIASSAAVLVKDFNFNNKIKIEDQLHIFFQNQTFNHLPTLEEPNFARPVALPANANKPEIGAVNILLSEPTQNQFDNINKIITKTNTHLINPIPAEKQLPTELINLLINKEILGEIIKGNSYKATKITDAIVEYAIKTFYIHHLPDMNNNKIESIKKLFKFYITNIMNGLLPAGLLGAIVAGANGASVQITAKAPPSGDPDIELAINNAITTANNAIDDAIPAPAAPPGADALAAINRIQQVINASKITKDNIEAVANPRPATEITNIPKVATAIVNNPIILSSIATHYPNVIINIATIMESQINTVVNDPNNNKIQQIINDFNDPSYPKKITGTIATNLEVAKLIAPIIGDIIGKTGEAKVAQITTMGGVVQQAAPSEIINAAANAAAVGRALTPLEELLFILSQLAVNQSVLFLDNAIGTVANYQNIYDKIKELGVIIVGAIDIDPTLQGLITQQVLPLLFTAIPANLPNLPALGGPLTVAGAFNAAAVAVPPVANIVTAFNNLHNDVKIQILKSLEAALGTVAAAIPAVATVVAAQDIQNLAKGANSAAYAASLVLQEIEKTPPTQIVLNELKKAADAAAISAAIAAKTAEAVEAIIINKSSIISTIISSNPELVAALLTPVGGAAPAAQLAAIPQANIQANIQASLKPIRGALEEAKKKADEDKSDFSVIVAGTIAGAATADIVACTQMGASVGVDVEKAAAIAAAVALGAHGAAPSPGSLIAAPAPAAVAAAEKAIKDFSLDVGSISTIASKVKDQFNPRQRSLIITNAENAADDIATKNPNKYKTAANNAFKIGPPLGDAAKAAFDNANNAATAKPPPVPTPTIEGVIIAAASGAASAAAEKATEASNTGSVGDLDKLVNDAKYDAFIWAKNEVQANTTFNTAIEAGSIGAESIINVNNFDYVKNSIILFSCFISHMVNEVNKVNKKILDNYSLAGSLVEAASVNVAININNNSSLKIKIDDAYIIAFTLAKFTVNNSIQILKNDGNDIETQKKIQSTVELVLNNAINIIKNLINKISGIEKIAARQNINHDLKKAIFITFIEIAIPGDAIDEAFNITYPLIDRDDRDDIEENINTKITNFIEDRIKDTIILAKDAKNNNPGHLLQKIFDDSDVSNIEEFIELLNKIIDEIKMHNVGINDTVEDIIDAIKFKPGIKELLVSPKESPKFLPKNHDENKIIHFFTTKLKNDKISEESKLFLIDLINYIKNNLDNYFINHNQFNISGITTDHLNSIGELYKSYKNIQTIDSKDAIAFTAATTKVDDNLKNANKIVTDNDTKETGRATARAIKLVKLIAPI